MKPGLALLSTIALAACAGGERPTQIARPIPFPTGGPGAVIGRSAEQLVAQFGQPSADVREGPGRKLQFAGAICILDAYLYPRGTGPALVTHVDARQPDGGPIDQASCVAASQRRSGGR